MGGLGLNVWVGVDRVFGRERLGGNSMIPKFTRHIRMIYLLVAPHSIIIRRSF